MKKVQCKIFGHTLIKKSTTNTLIKEYACRCCEKEFTQDGYGKIVHLNSFWKQNNLALQSLIK